MVDDTDNFSGGGDRNSHLRNARFVSERGKKNIEKVRKDNPCMQSSATKISQVQQMADLDPSLFKEASEKEREFVGKDGFKPKDWIYSILHFISYSSHIMRNWTVPSQMDNYFLPLFWTKYTISQKRVNYQSCIMILENLTKMYL